MKHLFQSRNNRLRYFLKAHARRLYPSSLLSLDLNKLQQSIDGFDEVALYERVNYYNKLTSKFTLSSSESSINDMRKAEDGIYFLDLIEYARYFSQEYKLPYLFGDITHVPDIPSIVKSRPVSDNTNSILINMDKVRHFYFVKNDIEFKNKQNKLVWRGSVSQEHRVKFMQKYFNHSPLIDVGDFSKGRSPNPQWYVPFMSINQQLKNKFILAIEGNDVATNTKWIMSSNSLCFMTKPKYETWFMEGQLIPGFHYVLIKDDYSDIEQKIDYYIDNTSEAEEIISNAQRYISQFRDNKVEDWLHLKVLEKYFRLSGQI